MQTLLLVILVAAGLGLLSAAVLGRPGSPLAGPLRFASNRLIQTTAALLLGWVGVVLVQDDDAVRIAVGVLLGLVSLAFMLIQALTVWAYVRGGSPGEEK